MNEVLQPFIEDFMIVYLDDIPIYSISWVEYVQHFAKVFKVLKKKLRLNLKKSKMAMQSLAYLALVVKGRELTLAWRK